jgi:GT2 family glycosyltransferase
MTAPHPATAQSRPRIAAVILNYRTFALTIDCLESLEKERASHTEFEAVVVDNASGDGSDDQIAAQIEARGWSSWVRLVRAGDNRGFSAGNNLGINAVKADVYWLLNSDTVVLPGALDEIARALDERPDAGLFGTRLEWPDGSARRSCFRFLKPPSELVTTAWTGPITRVFQNYEPSLPVSDTPTEPDWLCFASVLIRRSTIERIGLLDDNYFMYYEDIDFCRRARQAGIPIVYWPAARVIHLEGQTSSVTKADTKQRRRPAYYYASRARYYAKFHGRLGLLAANLWWGAGRAVSFSRELVGNKRPHTSQREARDIWIHWNNPLGAK